jgi:oligosaccharide repeat unit polymerase
MVDAGICILLALLPFYWGRLSMIAEISAQRVFLAGVRAAMVENQKDSFGVFTYILPAALLLSLVAAAIDDGSRRARIRTFAIIGITLGYYALTGSRLGSALTLIGVAAIGCLRSRRLYFTRLFSACAVLLVVFTVPAILLNKGGNSHLSLSDNTGNVAGSMRLYLLGGLVAFDQVVTGSAPYIRPEYSLRPFYRVAQLLDPGVEVPPQNLPFTQVPEAGNVYTIYCGYYVAFGWLGTCIAMLILGFALAWIYEHARAGSSQATVFYGLGVASLLVSGAADSFLCGISFNAQAALFVSAVFLVARLAPRRHELDQPSTGRVVLIRANFQPQR